MASHNGRMRFYRANELEQQFAELLKRLVADEALVLSYAAEKKNAADTTTLRATRSPGLRGEHSRLQERRSNIFSAFEDGALKREDLQWRLDDLGQKQSRALKGADSVARGGTRRRDSLGPTASMMFAPPCRVRA